MSTVYPLIIPVTISIRCNGCSYMMYIIFLWFILNSRSTHKWFRIPFSRRTTIENTWVVAVVPVVNGSPHGGIGSEQLIDGGQSCTIPYRRLLPRI